jgi:hypothetical protein
MYACSAVYETLQVVQAQIQLSTGQPPLVGFRAYPAGFQSILPYTVIPIASLGYSKSWPTKRSRFHNHITRIIIDSMLPATRMRIPSSLRGHRGLATPAQLPVKDCRSITPPYPRLLETLEDVRRVLPKGSKLTLAEKILYSHLRNPEESLGGGGKIRGERYLKLRPDRVAMQVSRVELGRSGRFLLPNHYIAARDSESE